jgi:EPS-associated MarR family transcriptional regulator
MHVQLLNASIFMNDEIRYRLLHCLEEKPQISQRELARVLGVSVGKVNYCLHALIEKGLLKIRNFRRTRNKLAYAYVLTPQGIQEKVDVTYRFLRYKMKEYDDLSAEIEQLKREVGDRLRPAALTRESDAKV